MSNNAHSDGLLQRLKASSIVQYPGEPSQPPPDPAPGPPDIPPAARSATL